MNLYTVNYWIPFPSSEYGGIYVVAAESVDQVVEVCIGATMDWDKDDYEPGYLEIRIRENTKQIGTTDLFDKPCVVESFWT